MISEQEPELEPRLEPVLCPELEPETELQLEPEPELELNWFSISVLSRPCLLFKKNYEYSFQFILL